MSDIARVYPPGKELAIGGQTGGQPEVKGQEKATSKNGDNGHDYGDGRTK